MRRKFVGRGGPGDKEPTIDKPNIQLEAGTIILRLREVRSLDRISPSDLAALSTSEVTRFNAFLLDDDRETYAAAHILARRALGKVIGCEPSAVSLYAEGCSQCGEPHGRPIVKGIPDLGVSLSHTSGAVLIGIARTSIGVDVENVPALETVNELVGELHSEERTYIEALPVEEQPAAFARLWVRKEAYLKALGLGLNRELHRDYLGPNSGLHPAGWLVRDIPCGVTHRAAIVVPKAKAKAKTIHLQHE